MSANKNNLRVSFFVASCICSDRCYPKLKEFWGQILKFTIYCCLVHANTEKTVVTSFKKSSTIQSCIGRCYTFRFQVDMYVNFLIRADNSIFITSYFENNCSLISLHDSKSLTFLRFRNFVGPLRYSLYR